MSANVWQSYALERDQLKVQLARQQRIDMTKLVGSADHADVVLIASDGVKVTAYNFRFTEPHFLNTRRTHFQIPAHLAIVELRAPAFYARYVRPAMTSKSTSVQLRDVNGDMLRCFLEAVYTRDEVDGETNEHDGTI